MPDIPTDFRYTTRRLTVAPLSGWRADPTLVKETAALLSPAVTAFLPPDLQVPHDGANAATWLSAAAADARVLGVRARDGALVGLVLLHPGAGPEIMFGYLLAEPVWGQGLGTELIRGLAEALHETLGTGVLVGGVDPANTASARVLRKAGFAQRPGQGSNGSVFYALDLARG